jgi:hypothetical protein
MLDHGKNTRRNTVPIAYNTDLDKKFITETWSGEVTAENLATYWKRLDLREARIQFDGSELKTLIQELVLPALNGRDWKTALVVDRPRQFGVSRQYQVYADRYSHDAIFYDLEKARDWLINSQP